MSPIDLLVLQQRFRELGRLRMGIKTSSGAPTSIETWRLTSANRALLDVAAGLWGGEVRPWNGAPDAGQFELITETGVVPIAVPPGLDPVSQWLEQWNRGGCTHRCNGQWNVITDSACSCNPEARKCKPTTRINLLLPDLPDLGVWRLESHGWNAAAELPGTLALISAAAAQGLMLPGTLRIEDRSQVKGGQTSRFRVPAIDLEVTVRELTAGGGAAAALGQAPAPPRQVGGGRAQLPPPTPLPAQPAPIGDQAAAPAQGEGKRWTMSTAQRRRLYAFATKAGISEETLRERIAAETGDPEGSTSSLTREQYDAFCERLDARAKALEQQAEAPDPPEEPEDPPEAVEGEVVDDDGRVRRRPRST